VSSLPEPAPSSRVDSCPLCGAPVTANEDRCPECNMTLAGVGARPAAFDRQSLFYWAGALLVIYLVVLAIVVVAR